MGDGFKPGAEKNMKSDELIIRNAWICQIKSEQINPIFGDLEVKNGIITKIHVKDFRQFIASKTKIDDRCQNIINAGGRVLTVPLVNFHDHFYSRLSKGLPFRGRTDSFGNILETIWWKLDRALDADMIRASVQIAAMEAIRNGVTYIFDHHASPDCTTDSLSIIAEILSDFNIRAVLCFEISDRNGKLKTKQALRENFQFIQKHTNKNIRGMIGLHAPFTLSDQSLQEVKELRAKLNIGIHIHLAEDSYEIDYSQELYNKSAVERLHNFELLTTDSILAHCIHVSENDYQLIDKAGCAIVYNPDSNLNNAVGLPNYAKKPDSIPALAGTDGMHANIARSLKQLFLLQRYQKNSFEQVFNSFQRMYMDSIHFARRFFPDFPSLSEGKRADFILWDYVPPTPFSTDNFWGHFIYGVLEYPLHSVIQYGQLLMHNFHLLAVDEQKIRENIFRQGERLFHKLKQFNK